MVEVGVEADPQGVITLESDAPLTDVAGMWITGREFNNGSDGEKEERKIN